MYFFPVRHKASTGRIAPWGGRGLSQLSLAIFVTFVVALPFPTLAQQAAPDRETVGKPWSGEKGSRESMADITARQQREDQRSKGKPKKFRLKTEKEAPDRDELPQDPNSPAVARWVPSRNIADNLSTLVAPLAPQSLGVNFTG